MYALQMQTGCQGEGDGEGQSDPNSQNPGANHPVIPDCSTFDIVKATQVKILFYS